MFINDVLSLISIDVVICWNIGTYWGKEKEQDIIPKMLQYGLTIEQIQQSPESSYAELIIWNACSIAKEKNCAVHIVDRAMHKITKDNDPYYKQLKKEFEFKKIKYVNIRATTLSQGGRKLITQGKLNSKREIPIVLVSILIT